MPSTPARQAELEHYPRYTTADDTYVHGLYRNALEDEEIKSYLKSSGQYDPSKKRWLIPEALTSVEVLIDALFTVASSVIDRLVRTERPSGERILVDTREIPECSQRDEGGYRPCPELMVHAAGPSFQMPKGLRDQHGRVPKLSLGFQGMATFITAALSSDEEDLYEQVGEMELYVRRILQEQPNRSFVRALLLTETHARMAHFDRAGAEITPLFDIHEHPATFVRLLAGVSSLDERTIGFDTSIQWSIVEGRKSNGTLTTTGPDGNPRTYRILGQLRTARKEIRGRATTCWLVQDPDTLEELVVKDSWRPESRRGEYELLESVKGIPGVVQMISYEIGRGETKDFRCPTTSGYFQNCVATRVATKLYGRSVVHFTSVLQLLCALRDAIAAHRTLVSDDIQILHRDIAPQNLLLGRVDAPEGERGVLIDFDLAFKATPEFPVTMADHTIGVRIFQPLSALANDFMRRKNNHDYLDDLQSFFYVLVYIMTMYRPDGSPFPSDAEGPTIMSKWNKSNCGDAYCEKQGIVGGGFLRHRISSLIRTSWGPICDDLFMKFRDWSSSRRTDKEKLAREGRTPDVLLSQRDEHYAAVLTIFDEAITAFTTAVEPNAFSQRRAPPQLPRALPSPAPHPRRSARIHNAVHFKTTTLAQGVAIPAPSTPTPQPRRSARIQKRRLEQEQHEEPGASSAKARRVTKAIRSPGSRY